MSSTRCRECGLVNFATAQQCKRCGAFLTEDGPVDVATGEEAVTDVPKKRSIGKRVSWIIGMTLVVLLICYMSLLVTSDSIKWQQRQTVDRAITVLEQKGFGKEAFVLRRLVSFRTSDNWWNMQVGHHDAYAATNFPFEVLTLYPEFFDSATDDTERAAILLHESYHLFGSNERAALEGVWRNKSRIGWTADKYAETKVWKNTRELTMSEVPQLFRCGLEGKDDCIP
ncbi:MAG TPA: hypothetical protein VE842_14360 [Pyrinomonadaceae bacterium]|jgi:hypothetical protein|nr:hypothetical protein [Pyrinomonadaceae bacterium]